MLFFWVLCSVTFTDAISWNKEQYKLWQELETCCFLDSLSRRPLQHLTEKPVSTVQARDHIGSTLRSVKHSYFTKRIWFKIVHSYILLFGSCNYLTDLWVEILWNLTYLTVFWAKLLCVLLEWKKLGFSLFTEKQLLISTMCSRLCLTVKAKHRTMAGRAQLCWSFAHSCMTLMLVVELSHASWDRTRSNVKIL